MALPQQLGRYVLERRLAAGGMAEVFLAKQSGPEGFEKVCVVKRMLPHLTQEEAFVSMFLDEARLAARLTHPNIAQIFDFGHSDDSYFLAMEYVPGANLHAVVEDHTLRHQRLPIDAVVRIVALASAGLDFAHHATDPAGAPLNIIHRDISPHNIMLSKNGDVKLIDFGIAKASVGLHATKVGTLKGKYAYMSPEQIRGLPIDRRTDVYAMGLVLYELLAGRPAVQGDSESTLMAAAAKRDFPGIETLRSDIPLPVRAVLERALAMSVNDRYATAGMMTDDLEDFLTASGTRVRGTELAALLTPDAEVTAVTSMPVPSHTPTRPPTHATPIEQTQTESGSATLSDADPSPDPEYDDAPTTLRQPREPEGRAITRPDVPVEVSSTAASAEVDPEPTSPQVSPLELPGPRKFPLALALGVIALAGAAIGVAWVATQPGSSAGDVVLVPPPPERTEPKPEPVAAAPAQPTAHTPTPSPVEAPPMPAAPRTPEPAGAVADPPVKTRHPSASHSPKSVSPATPAVAAGKGTVTFRVLPYAEVFRDGTSLGVTPMKPLELEPGRYTFKLVCADTKKSETREVTLAAGVQTVVKVDLR